MSKYFYEITYKYREKQYETDSEIETRKSAIDRAKRLKEDREVKHVRIIKKVNHQ